MSSQSTQKDGIISPLNLYNINGNAIRCMLCDSLYHVRKDCELLQVSDPIDYLKILLKYIKTNDLDNVKKLIETDDGKVVINDFDNKKVNNPLILASKKGYKDIIEILLKNGADFNIENIEGETAIEYVVDKECKTLLLNAGAIIYKPIPVKKLLKIDVKYDNKYKSWVFGRFVTETFSSDVLFMMCPKYIYIRPLEKMSKAQFQIFFGFGCDCSGFTTDRIVHIKKKFLLNCRYMSLWVCNAEKNGVMFSKYENGLNENIRQNSAKIIQKFYRKFSRSSSIDLKTEKNIAIDMGMYDIGQESSELNW